MSNFIINVEHVKNNSVWYEDYNGWSIRINADTDYLLNDDFTLQYEDENGDFHNEKLSLNGAKSMASKTVYDVTENTEFVINGSVKDKNALTIVNNIANCNVNVVKSGYNATATATANDGFKFSSAPKVTFYSDDYGYNQTKTLTLSADETTATGSLNYPDFTEPFTFNGETISTGTPELTVTNEIANTELEQSFDGETATITVKGKYPRYRFINPSVNYTDTNGDYKSVPMNVEQQTTGATATAVLTDVEPTEPVTVTGRYINVAHVELYLSNCSPSEILPDFYLPNTDIEITLIADDGTEFNPDNAPYLQHQNENGYYVTKEFTVSADKQTATVNYTLPDYEITSVSVNGQCEPVQTVGGNYGAINVYVVTLDTLQEFAKQRFFKENTGADGNTDFTYIDLGKYVNRIKRIFATVPEFSNDVLRAGNYNTNIPVKQPATDKLTLDFGTLSIPAPNNDTTDYESELSLFIPFAGFISLPSDYAGEQINLQIDINVITGNGVAKLFYNGILFNVVELQPSANILYRTADTELTTIGADDWNENLYYGLEPYLYVKWFESANPTGRNNDSQRGLIGDFRGFNSFTEITPISANTMLADEQTALYNDLQRGVYIE